MTKLAHRVATGFAVLIALCLAGCGSNSGTIDHSSNAIVPSIVKQPVDQSVPMGLAGTFSVQAVGVGLQYQWSRNGSPISGATANTYTTPGTVFRDTGSTFAVTISNTSGSVTSNAATLTVTARAPKAGDLRFQQVDAASTINGYAIELTSYSVLGCPVPGQGGMGFSFPSATGTGYFLSNHLCPWQFTPFSLPAGVTGLDVGYAGLSAANYQDYLNAPTFISFPGPSDPGSVITSFDLIPSQGAAGFGFIHSDTSSGFTPMRYTVAGAALQTLATQEGLSGRVITAVSYDGTNATVFSYGWTGDPNTVYESSVVFATVDTATAAIQQLAAEGYIVTATASSQAVDGSGVVLIGTRVQGDTMPRRVLVGDALNTNPDTVDPIFAQGYAIVAVVEKYQNNALVLKNYVGER